MPDQVSDGFEKYYAAKLWSLLPEVYRAEDSAEHANGPLRELVGRLGAQAAVLRRSIDRLWEDQSIESCDEWVIAYIADLLATNLVASLDARGQRVDVAKTIYYRRRKGTLPLVEELAANITGWDARVVEFFRRLGRTRHGLDPAFGWPIEVVGPHQEPTLVAAEGLVGTRTRTPAGGWADLRNVYGTLQNRTAFDEFSYTCDVRIGRGATGWHNIPRVGVFLWRLNSIPAVGVTPVGDVDCPDQLTFDPTGRDVPLFAVRNRTYGGTWVSPREQDLPTPIHQPLFRTAFDELYGWGKAIAIFLGDPYPEDVISPGSVSGDPHAFPNAHFVDPERGRVHLAPGTDAAKILVAYHHGSPSTIGAGGFDRRLPGERTTLPQPIQDLTGGGGAFTTAPSSGTIRFRDSRTYVSMPATITIAPGGTLVVAAENRQRPVLRVPAGTTWTFVGQADANGAGSELVLDGLLLCGSDVVLKGVFDKVTIKTCTIDPGESPDGTVPAKAADGAALAPGHLTVEGSIGHLELDRCVLGPLSMDPDPAKAELEVVDIRDCVVQAVLSNEDAIDFRSGTASVLRTTILGRSQFHRIEASNVIFDDVATALDAQEGCTRFCAVADGSQLPRRYEWVPIAPDQELFVSRSFANPAYAQLLESVDDAILLGADNGSEIGAYCREKGPVKARSLLVKFQEYMPVGVTPVLIYVT